MGNKVLVGVGDGGQGQSIECVAERCSEMSAIPGNGREVIWLPSDSFLPLAESQESCPYNGHLLLNGLQLLHQLQGGRGGVNKHALIDLGYKTTKFLFT